MAYFSRLKKDDCTIGNKMKHYNAIIIVGSRWAITTVCSVDRFLSPSTAPTQPI